ncbi:MAG TPA: DUF2628 domain-containing protein [Xanthobacteraceae bacterium]
MTVYMVFEPPPPRGDALKRAERIAFVPDRFTWSAFLLAPLWMLWHRLWIVLAGYIGVSVAISLALRAAGVDADARSFALMLFALLIGFEATSLRRWTLRLKGWREVGAVVGDSRETAEQRFFDYEARGERPRETAAASPPPPPPPVAPRATPDVVGLFPQPGGGG